MPSDPSFDVAGHRVLLTGAAGGLGRGVATAFHAWGARVGLVDLEPAAATSAAGSIDATLWSGGIDVTDEASVDACIGAFLQEHGGIDLLIHAAGILTTSNVVDMTLADWDKVMRVNATGTFLTNRAAARAMITAGGGSIVNVASLGAKVGDAEIAHYCASKFAVVGFTQSLAKELGQHGITVNAVCPGVVETPMIEELGRGWGMSVDEMVSIQIIKRPQSPADIAHAIRYLHTNRSVTGQAINIDGGTAFY